MEFSVEFYINASGRSPVRQFLDDLKKTDPGDHASLLRGLEKLRHRQYHRPPLCKALGNGLFELRHVGKLNTRILWFFVRDRRIIAVHGIRNKSQAIPARDLGIAEAECRTGMGGLKMKKTNFDLYLEEQLKDPEFAERFERAGEAWDVALQLTALREQSGLSQAELARKLRTTQQQISRLESPDYEVIPSACCAGSRGC